MTIKTTYIQAQTDLADLLDAATEDREIVIIQRDDKEDAAIIAADELSSLLETAYLMRSPVNADRILTALNRALKNEGAILTREELTVEVGLGEDPSSSIPT